MCALKKVYDQALKSITSLDAVVPESTSKWAGHLEEYLSSETCSPKSLPSPSPHREGTSLEMRSHFDVACSHRKPL